MGVRQPSDGCDVRIDAVAHFRHREVGTVKHVWRRVIRRLGRRRRAGPLAIRGVVLGGCFALGACCAAQTHGIGGVHYTFDIQSTGCCTLIAHAGGSIDGNAYSDSREALQLSIRNGFRLVEMDFDQTRDGNWFTVHDWTNWSKASGYRGSLPPPTSVVKAREHELVVTHPELYSIPGTYSNLSLDELLGILTKHPGVRIITDTKGDDAAIDLIERIKQTPLVSHFVFQVYSLDGLKRAAMLVPQQQLILTTYLLPDWYTPDGFGAAFLAAVKQYPHLFALTIPMKTAHDHAKMKRIKAALSIPILAHGEPKFINSRNFHLQLGEWGVNGVYVD